MLIKFWKLVCKSLKAFELPVELIVILSVVLVVMVIVSPVVELGAVLVVEAGVEPVVGLGAVLVVDAGVELAVEFGVVLVEVVGIVLLGVVLELVADNCCKRFCRSDIRFELLLRPLPLPPLLSPSESVLPLFEDPA